MIRRYLDALGHLVFCLAAGLGTALTLGAVACVLYTDGLARIAAGIIRLFVIQEVPCD